MTLVAGNIVGVWEGTKEKARESAQQIARSTLGPSIHLLLCTVRCTLSLTYSYYRTVSSGGTLLGLGISLVLLLSVLFSALARCHFYTTRTTTKQLFHQRVFDATPPLSLT